jgi:hypothetical protein
MNDGGHESGKRTAPLAVVTMAHALLASRTMDRINFNQAATEAPLPAGQWDAQKAWLAGKSGTDGHDT